MTKISITQPIRIPFDSRAKSYRAGRWLAYPTLFLLLAGDAVRYLVGWYGYAAAAVAGLIAVSVFVIANPDKTPLRRFPLPLAILLAYMGLSVIWSNYPQFTLAAFGVQ